MDEFEREFLSARQDIKEMKEMLKQRFEADDPAREV